MEVTEYEIIEAPPRNQLLKITTDEGVSGWGEAYMRWYPNTTGPTTRAAIHEFMSNYVVGEDPTRIEDLWHAMYLNSFHRGGPIQMSAISAINIALWDLKGRSLDVPIYELLGGRVRDAVPTYQWVSTDGEGAPEDVALTVQEKVDDGSVALKLTPFGRTRRIETRVVRETANRMEAIRDRIGYDVDLAIEFHGRPSKALARKLASVLAEFDPLFYEEIVAPEHTHSHGSIADHSVVPLAAGERLFHRSQFKPLLEGGSIDILQPDVTLAGGITELKKIADMGEVYDVSFSPHGPSGPVGKAATLQLDACCRNVFIQDFNPAGSLPFLQDSSVFDINEEGMCKIPDGSGLGIDIDEDYLRSQAEEGLDYSRSVWRLEDGTVVER